MNRWTLRILLLLLLLSGGAIVNVAVAWGCMAAWPKPVDSEEYIVMVGRNPAAELLVDSWDSRQSLDHRRFVTCAESRPGWIEFEAVYQLSWQKPFDDDMAWFVVLHAGWPAKGLRGDYRSPVDEEDGEYCYALMIPDALQPAHGRLTLWDYAPLLPLWPGFAINTVFYAAILWLLFFAPGRIRRAVRIKRGRCPKCAYDLRGHTGGERCPECGAEIRTTAD